MSMDQFVHIDGNVTNLIIVKDSKVEFVLDFANKKLWSKVNDQVDEIDKLIDELKNSDIEKSNIEKSNK